MCAENWTRRSTRPSPLASSLKRSGSPPRLRQYNCRDPDTRASLRPSGESLRIVHSATRRLSTDRFGTIRYLRAVLGQQTSDRHLHILGETRAPDNVKRAVFEGREIQIPIASSRGYHYPRPGAGAAGRMHQIRVCAVWKVFVAKNDVHRLGTEDFLSLKTRRTHGHVHLQRFQCSQ